MAPASAHKEAWNGSSTTSDAGRPNRSVMLVAPRRLWTADGALALPLPSPPSKGIVCAARHNRDPGGADASSCDRTRAALPMGSSGVAPQSPKSRHSRSRRHSSRLEPQLPRRRLATEHGEAEWARTLCASINDKRVLCRLRIQLGALPDGCQAAAKAAIAARRQLKSIAVHHRR